MPKISVIVPIYNVYEYLEKCLDSLVNQTLEDIEIILINDGSPDNSEEIVEKYINKYPDKIVYHKKKNEGQGVARNYGIKIARGEFISFVDSDDYVDLNLFKKLYDKAIEENADIVFTNGLIEVRENDVIYKMNEFNSDDVYKRYILNNSGPVGKIIRRELIQDNKLYFPKLRAYEDIAIVPLWCMYAKKISCIDEALYYYLIREGSTMKQIEYNEKLTNIYESLDNLYKNKKLIEDYNEELEWIFIEHLLHAASLRFLSFNKLDEIRKINKIIKERYSHWYNNQYYATKSIKYKLVCLLIYKEHFRLLKLLLK